MKPREEVISSSTKTTIPSVASEGYDPEEYNESKVSREKWMAEKAKIDTETKRVEHALLIGKLIRTDDAQSMLEKEHQLWLSTVEDWRQTINKKIGKLGLPVEMQDAITEMISKEITSMRQKRAVSAPK